MLCVKVRELTKHGECVLVEAEPRPARHPESCIACDHLGLDQREMWL